MAPREKKVVLARLVFIAVYSVAFVAAGFGHWSQPVFIVEYILIAVLWVVLLLLFVRERRSAAEQGSSIWRNPAIPLLLLSPIFLFLDWNVVWFLLVVAAYVFELRRHAAGDGFAFSFGLIAFVGVLAALTMVELENDNPASEFTGPSDALYWAFGGLLRINTGRSYSATTEDGRFMVIVVTVCGVIAASMFTARLVSWIVGTGQARRPADVDLPAAAGSDEVAELRAEIQELRSQLRGRAEGAAAAEEPPSRE